MFPPTDFSLEPVLADAENSKEEIVRSGLQIDWAGVMAQRSCGNARRLLFVSCPRASLLFLPLNLRQRERSGRAGVSVGLAIPMFVIAPPSCLPSRSRPACLTVS